MCLQAIGEAGSDPLEAEAHQLAAEMSMLSGDIAHAIEHARRAAELAERAGETAMLIESLGTLCHYETYTGPITPGLLERAVELERAAPRPSNNYSPREILGLRLMYADRLDEARELLEESLDWTAEIGDELDRNSLLIHLTQLECRAGRPSRAAQHAKEGLTISEQTGGWALAAPLFAVSLAAAHLGDVPAAREAGETGLSVAESGGSGVFRVLNQWALGFLALSLGDAPGADRRLHELPGELEAMGYRNPGVRPVYPDAIEATDHVGRPRRGAPDRPARGVRPGAGQPLGPGCGGAMPWSAPGVAGGHRRRDRRAGARPGRARALASAPRAGQDAAGTGSGPASGQAERDARTSLQEALDAFEGIGAALWAERARKELGLPEARGPLPHRARVEARALTKQTSGVPGFLGGPGKSGVIEVGRREAQP